LARITKPLAQFSTQLLFVVFVHAAHCTHTGGKASTFSRVFRLQDIRDMGSDGVTVAPSRAAAVMQQPWLKHTPYWPGARFPMTVTTVMLFDEQRDTLIAAATSAREQVTACAESLRLMPALQAEYRSRAAALCNALAALDANALPGNLAAELRELQAQHAALQRQLEAEKARGDALAAALRNALERLGPAASPAEVEAARVLVSHA
jgi:hypothetical protein